jgi:hypothetical protein
LTLSEDIAFNDQNQDQPRADRAEQVAGRAGLERRGWWPSGAFSPLDSLPARRTMEIQLPAKYQSLNRNLLDAV